MKWFRLHAEARNDAKLKSLTDAEHRVWFNLLCYASEMEERGCIIAVDRELLSVECASADTELLNATIARLTKLRIVTAEQENVCFVNFMKRQYDKPSDSPERVLERVNRHRAKQETQKTHAETPETQSVTPCNAIETPKERAYSDTDTDTEDKNTPLPPNGGIGGWLDEDCPDQEHEAGQEYEGDVYREDFDDAAASASSPPKRKPRTAQAITLKHDPAGFAAFWAAYPRKVAKVAAMTAWNKAQLTPAEQAALIAALPALMRSEQWTKDGGGYIPHPASFLNGRRWEDEAVQSAPPAFTTRPYRMYDPTKDAEFMARRAAPSQTQ